MGATIAWLALSTLPVSASAALDSGIKEYNAGNYQRAIGLFGQAESTDFNNPVLHYYLANALAKTNKIPDALKQYKVAMAMEPTGQLANYCRDAIAALDGNSASSSRANVPASSASAKSAPIFNYQFDTLGNPTEVSGKIGAIGKFVLKRTAVGAWMVKEMKNSQLLVICGVKITTKGDGTIVGPFKVSNQGDIGYLDPKQQVLYTIFSDGAVSSAPPSNLGIAAWAVGGSLPEVTATFCGCPACSRIESDFGSLQYRYGDRVKFTRRGSSTPGLTATRASANCPIITFSHGRGTVLITERGQYITAGALENDINDLLSAVSLKPQRTLQEQNTASQAAEIAKDAQVKIADGQERLESEIGRLEDEQRAYAEGGRGSRASDVQDRARRMREDFERQKQAINATAKARIESLTHSDASEFMLKESAPAAVRRSNRR